MKKLICTLIILICFTVNAENTNSIPNYDKQNSIYQKMDVIYSKMDEVYAKMEPWYEKMEPLYEKMK